MMRRTAAPSHSPAPAAMVSAMCKAGLSSSPIAAASPPCDQALAAPWPGPMGLSSRTGAGAAARAAISPARPPPMIVMGGWVISRRACVRPPGGPARHIAGSISTSVCIVSSAARMFFSVMRFICGHRLQGRTNSMAWFCCAILSLIEHSVISATRAGCLSVTNLAISRGGAGIIGDGDDLGRAFGMREDRHARMALAQRSEYPRR